MRGGGDVDDARAALPSADYLKIAVPGSQGAKVGEISDAYKITRGVTAILNGGAAVVLILARTVTLFPPTSIEGNTYVWGPWDGNALNPAQYRMTVTRQSDGDYAWSFEGRRKADGPTAPYLSVVSGLATPGRPGHGSGTFSIDFDVAEQLDPVGNSGEGNIAVAYDLESEPKTITIDWENDIVLNGVPQTAMVEYSYAEALDGSGDFQFAAFDDTDDPGILFERIEMRSRWNATGAGRGDARITGGDLSAGVMISATECWGTEYTVVYRSDSANWVPPEGDPNACAFSQAFPE